MSTKRKYDMASVRLAIEVVGPSPSKIAAYLGANRATINRYLKRYPELKAAAARQGDPAVDRPQYPENVFIEAIKGSKGIKSAVVRRVGCSRGTLENAIIRWPQLEQLIEDERHSLVDFAESKLLEQIQNNDMRAILFTLETLGKDRGWSKRTEISGKDGAPLFNIPQDVVKLIEQRGLDMNQVLSHFVNMIRTAPPGERVQ